MNRTLMKTAWSMMACAGLPDKYWAEAVETAAYIRNRTPTTAIKDYKTLWSLERRKAQHWTFEGVWMHGICTYTRHTEVQTWQEGCEASVYRLLHSIKRLLIAWWEDITSLRSRLWTQNIGSFSQWTIWNIWGIHKTWSWFRTRGAEWTRTKETIGTH